MRRIMAALLTVSLLGTVGAMTLLSSGCADEEGGEGVPEGQSWSGGNWAVELERVIWYECFLYVDLTITHSGDVVAHFGYDDTESKGSLYVRDQAGVVFEVYAPYPWQRPVFEKEFYPNEVREGRVEYEMDPRSEQVTMHMEPNIPGAGDFKFNLGVLPESCRR